jgi:hypothetical protein
MLSATSVTHWAMFSATSVTHWTRECHHWLHKPTILADLQRPYHPAALHCAGDMDLNAGRGGQYRLQASVPGVEINAARASLGINPIPFPVAGAVRGVLHATGPLEHPIFSGQTSNNQESWAQILRGWCGHFVHCQWTLVTWQLGATDNGTCRD